MDFTEIAVEWQVDMISTFMKRDPEMGRKSVLLTNIYIPILWFDLHVRESSNEDRFRVTFLIFYDTLDCDSCRIIKIPYSRLQLTTCEYMNLA